MGQIRSQYKELNFKKGLSKKERYEETCFKSGSAQELNCKALYHQGLSCKKFICRPLVVSLLATCAIHNNASATGIGVNNSDKQTIKGWGIFPSYHHTSYWGGENDILNRSGVQQAIYADLGVSHMRVDLIGGYYDGSKSDRLALTNSGQKRIQNLLDHIKKAREKNPSIKYIISVWMPPASLKSPAIDNARSGNTIAHLIGYGTGDANSIPSTQETEFCNWIAAALKYLNDNGVGLPVALSLQNEPTYAPDYVGCQYDSNQYVRVAKKLRSTLNNANFSSVTLIAAEGNNYGDTSTILGSNYSRFGDYTFNNAIGAIATHSYDNWSDNSGRMNYYWQLDSGINAYPSKELWMTEWCPIGNLAPANSQQIDWTIGAMRHFAREMVRFRTQYWFWWMGWTYNASASPENLLWGQVPNYSSTTPNKSKAYYVLSKLWKSAPPGCKVRDLWSDDWGVFLPSPQSWDAEADMVAFKNASNMVVLIVNDTYNWQDLMVYGLSGSSARIYQTTSSEDMADKGVSSISGGSTYVGIPARSITIVVTNG